jgi:GxxExxY protein
MPLGETTSPEIEGVAKEIVDAAYKVHYALGPGLLEHAYKVLMKYELEKRGLLVEVEVSVPVVYDRKVFDTQFRIDMLVERLVVVELKAVDQMHPVFKAQVMTYLRLTGKRLGLLINFNVEFIKDGIKRVIL